MPSGWSANIDIEIHIDIGNDIDIDIDIDIGIQLVIDIHIDVEVDIDIDTDIVSLRVHVCGCLCVGVAVCVRIHGHARSDPVPDLVAGDSRAPRTCCLGSLPPRCNTYRYMCVQIHELLLDAFIAPHDIVSAQGLLMNYGNPKCHFIDNDTQHKCDTR